MNRLLECVIILEEDVTDSLEEIAMLMFLQRISPNEYGKGSLINGWSDSLLWKREMDSRKFQRRV